MGHDVYKATVEFGANKVTFEGTREFVEAQVSKFAALVSSKQVVGELADGGGTSSSPMQLSERELVKAKQPKGHPETVAVLAFALAQSGVEEFTEGDMRRAYLPESGGSATKSGRPGA
jgi:hypothetical protein